jgi:HD-like signal output (HDOD) protein
MGLSNFKTEIRSRFENLEDMPALPETARRVLELRAKDEPAIVALAKLIELDPSLSAQVIRYARSTLYGYRGKIDSVEAAISRVLGYDVVLNIALSLATTKPFKIPRSGKLGADEYWMRAVRCAILSQGLCHAMPATREVSASFAYLGGLLHEFGLLVIGHLYPKDYAKLNLLLANNPEVDLIQLERATFGITHTEAGARILRAWNLPDEIIVPALKHTDDKFQGIHQDYVHLIQLANQLLNYDEENPNPVMQRVSPALMAKLDLDEAAILKIAQQIIPTFVDMNSMIRKLAA